jgi:hypothetical protein
VEEFLSLPPPLAVPEAERRQGIGQPGAWDSQRVAGKCSSEALLNRDVRYGPMSVPAVALNEPIVPAVSSFTPKIAQSDPR